MSKDYCLTMDFALGQRVRGLVGPVLITGHTGFKGTWLTFLLQRLEIPVIGLSLAPTKDSLFERAQRIHAIPEVFADIRNYQSVMNFVDEFRPSAIFHLAAQPIVLESYKTPRETFETNVMGTANVLEAAFQSESVKVVGVVTTDKVYRNDNSGRAFIESDPLAGKDPYSASKVGAESVVAAWQQIAKVSGGPKITSLRAGNVIGGGDWAADRLLPDLIRGFNQNETVLVRNPESTRPWQHVLDPLHGYLLALEYLLSGSSVDAFNFGPDTDSLSVKEVVELSRVSWPKNTKVEYAGDSGENINEARSLHLNSTLAHELLQWQVAWSQRRSVEATIHWWDRVLNDEASPAEACAADIEDMLST